MRSICYLIIVDFKIYTFEMTKCIYRKQNRAGVRKPLCPSAWIRREYKTVGMIVEDSRHSPSL